MAGMHEPSPLDRTAVSMDYLSTGEELSDDQISSLADRMNSAEEAFNVSANFPPAILGLETPTGKQFERIPIVALP